MRIIIPAAGDGSRWGNYLGIPKHLIKVDGETLLERNMRLWSPHGDVTIVATDPRYNEYGPTWTPQLTPSNHEADKFLSSRPLWSDTDPTLVIFGDVYFTASAVTQILEHSTWQCFGRTGRNRYTGKRHEVFGHVFSPSDQPRHLSALERVVRSWSTPRGVKEAAGWMHYRAMAGFGLSEHKTGPLWTEIDDWTDDFDKPDDYDTWIACRAIMRTEDPHPSLGPASR